MKKKHVPMVFLWFSYGINHLASPPITAILRHPMSVLAQGLVQEIGVFPQQVIPLDWWTNMIFLIGKLTIFMAPW